MARFAIVSPLDGTIVESDAGWSSLAARRAHNPKVTGSNPVPATNNSMCILLQLVEAKNTINNKRETNQIYD
jgi:hypothetical protein